jgi:rubrerythrin
MDIKKVYEYALQREYEGKRFFIEYASRLSHASAVGVFNRLAQEEQKHIEFIQRQIDLLMENKPSDLVQANVLEQSEFFSIRASNEFIDQTVSEAMVPDLPILRMAYLIERDFAEFYENAAKQAEGIARKALETLAYWERRHEHLFKELHDKAYNEYSKMPWGG